MKQIQGYMAIVILSVVYWVLYLYKSFSERYIWLYVKQEIRKIGCFFKPLENLFKVRGCQLHFSAIDLFNLWCQDFVTLTSEIANTESFCDSESEKQFKKITYRKLRGRPYFTYAIFLTFLDNLQLMNIFLKEIFASRIYWIEMKWLN